MELQRLKPKYDVFLDSYNKFFRGYFYRVFLVSLKTIPRKINLKIALKSVSLYIRLNLLQKTLSRELWIHGDLNKNNYFFDQSGNLYFIDFENMFCTRKWCMAEIIGKSFEFNKLENRIRFNQNFASEYLRQSNIGNDQNFILKNQFRFGLLHHAIHQIAQTGSNSKRKVYISLLKMTLDHHLFNEWFYKNVPLNP